LELIEGSTEKENKNKFWRKRIEGNSKLFIFIK
jgi:hypothetical protein